MPRERSADGAMGPRPWIECGPKLMMESLARKPRSYFALVAGALAVVALAGCAIKHPTADLVAGKQLFVAKCGSCHTLARASSSGQIGPNLDDAFRQDRADGVKSTSIQGLVDYWIRYPNTQGVMPAGLIEGQKAQDVAAYVGAVAGKPGQDTGALATAVAAVNQKPAVEKNGALEIDADPTGQLKFLAFERQRHRRQGDDQDAEQVLGHARHRDPGQRGPADGPARGQRRHLDGQRQPEAGDVHVLLLGSGARGGRDEGNPDRQVAPAPASERGWLRRSQSSSPRPAATARAARRSSSAIPCSLA